MAFNVLVVDDQRDVSKAIRAGIQSLDSQFEIATVMSGEEAMLEARLRKFDLLISEIRLTGMSGVELVRKLRAAKPDIKVILVSVATDRYIRREIADSNVDAFLQKPLEIPDLLSQVEQLLGLKESVQSIPQLEQVFEAEPLSISDRLSILRKDLNASVALLMSDTGEILMEAGDLQNIDLSGAIPSLLAAFGAGHRISRFLGMSIPDNYLTFKGNLSNFIMTYVGESHGLLVIIPPPELPLERIDSVYQLIHKATHDLKITLTDMGVPLMVHEEQTPTETMPDSLEAFEQSEEIVEIDETLDAELEVLFGGGKDEEKADIDLDSFWDISSSEESGLFTSADALSYEQARQLGLTPGEE